MEELYRALYHSLQSRDLASVTDSVNILVPIIGAQYDRQPVKLMLIGRAVNGWDEPLSPDMAEETFVRCALSYLADAGRFRWIHGDDSATLGYNINRSAFWRTARSVLHVLAGTSQADWYERIVWSNLYCAAPKESGNPTEKMKTSQSEICRQLLSKLIDYCKPTHLLFDTGWDGWFANFADLLPYVERTYHETMHGSASGARGRTVVEGLGAEEGRLVVVTSRPERRSESTYVERVAEAFESLASRNAN